MNQGLPLGVHLRYLYGREKQQGVGGRSFEV
jgi:hypothetical protein